MNDSIVGSVISVIRWPMYLSICLSVWLSMKFV